MWLGGGVKIYEKIQKELGGEKKLAVPQKLLKQHVKNQQFFNS